MPARVRDDIVRLAHRGSTSGLLARGAVPFDGVCALTLDPATLLPIEVAPVRGAGRKPSVHYL